ncbi:hypothetical protein [Kluyvera chengduensis]|uniref:hypothetical protein n=1 Tax=Kluyvera sp. 142359 TaxID=3375726 RepID=UPI0037735F0A
MIIARVNGAEYLIVQYEKNGDPNVKAELIRSLNKKDSVIITLKYQYLKDHVDNIKNLLS